MSPVSRRIVLYWLLLLIPTVLVGVAAISLLLREEGNLARQQASALESRRAAVAGRTGLIVENIELLVSDVQEGLLESLASFDASALDDRLAAWERASPLVRTAFRCDLDGAIRRPGEDAADEEARGFRRRFADLFASEAPWGPAAAEQERKQEAETDRASARLRSNFNRAEMEAREVASQNVAQLQMARRDAQNVSKVRNYGSSGSGSSPVPAAAPASLAASAPAEEPSRQVEAFGDSLSDAAAPARRSGWLPRMADGRLHLLGWLQAGSQIRGVELEVSALIARLGAALPSEPAAGEGFALRDARGRVMHQIGWAPGGEVTEPVVRLPVAENLLPGWEVVAFLEAPAADTGGNRLLLLGFGLVAILLVAIVAGGSLLFWQARRSEAEAAQKTSFVANVSHEFKTPLTTIRLYSELLEQGRVADDSKRAEYLRTIGRETQRLSRLVGNALDFSRLEQGRKRYARDPIDLRDELSRLLDTQAPRMAEAGLRVERDLPDEAVVVATDRDAVEQVLLNLLDNAAKYAAAGGVALVGLRQCGTGATVRVLDRGPGVPFAHRERIFEKFHRVDDTLTAEKTGAGLGLSIARQLARGLGGDLRYAPREGGGAEFVFELP